MEIETREIRLPWKSALAEINLPVELIESLAGKVVSATVHPEEAAMSRQVKPDDVPHWIRPDGTYWNDYRPERVSYTDPEGRLWRLPSRWLSGVFPDGPAPALSVSQESVFGENLNLPSEWDLWEINLPWEIAHRAAGKGTLVQVRLRPDEPVEVLWRDPDRNIWRIPHDWRRRRILLPSREVLASQGIPEDVATNCAGITVSVNYHPGSLCCLPEHYRFRDDDGNKWPVKISDCTLLGYGDRPEFKA